MSKGNGLVTFLSGFGGGYDQDLYSVPATGGQRRLLATGINDYAWSPDGRRLALLKHHPRDEFDTAGADLYLARADGSGLRPLGRPKIRGDLFEPRFSPDGSRIAFFRFGGLVVIGIHDRRCLQAASPDNAYTWSPDGSVIAYDQGAGLDPSESEIDMVGAGGGRSVPIGKGHHLISGGDPNPTLEAFSWSPDGRRILLLRSIETDNYQERADVYVLDLSTGKFRNFTRDPTVIESDAFWAPDGKRIMVVANRRTYSISADGSGSRQRICNCEPVLSPD